MYINQKLIAEKAGVSCATVSRAFTKNARVHPRTMEKILTAMEEMGIEAPETFFSKMERPKQILVLVGDVSDEFYARTIKGISDQAHSMGMIATLCNSNFDFDIESRYLYYAEENNYAGVIMLTIEASQGMIRLLRDYSLPVVLVNRFIRTLDMDVVCIDNYRGGYMAANHLLSKGHRKIAYLAGKHSSSAQQDRLKGFSDAMADAGLDFPEKNVFWGDNSRGCGKVFVNQFFAVANRYTAVFAANNPMAAGAVNRLLEMGYHVPNDVSMICFDDVSPASEENIKLTTISHDPYLMGMASVDTLLKRIKNPFQEKMRVIYSPHITVRESIRDLASDI